jgi:hypothetical protein
VFLACIVLAFAGYKFFNQTKSNAPFEKTKLTRLTNNGKVAGAAISPDGKHLALTRSIQFSDVVLVESSP